MMLQNQQSIERDICYFLHEQKDWRSILGDLAFGVIYAAPYWEYLTFADDPPSSGRQQFVQNGCLLIILAMAVDVIDGSGTYLRQYLEPCRQSVAAMRPSAERTCRLRETVLLALAHLARGSRSDDLDERLAWASCEFVHGYYRSVAREIDEEFGQWNGPDP